MGRTGAIIVCFICIICLLQAGTNAAKKIVKKKHGVSETQVTSAVTTGTYFNKGKQYLAKNEYEKAITQFQKAVARAPDNGTYRYFLADAYYKAGYYKEAEQELTQVGILEPKLRTQAKFLQGLIKYELGELAEAKALFFAVANVEQGTLLGGRAERMLKRVEETMAVNKDWGMNVSIGSETDDNLATQFQDALTADQGTVTDFNIWYRPFWWRGILLEFASSQIVYQKLTSANITAQVFHIGSDLETDPLLSFDYTYSYYWLNSRPYYRSDLIKFMLNLHLVPWENYARTGFFISGEQKQYFPAGYDRYDAQVSRVGAEQTLLSDALLGSAYYLSSWSEIPENDYKSVNYSLSVSFQLIRDLYLNGAYRYEFRAYNDYYGYNRQDAYKEPMYGLRKYFADIWSVAVERRNITNESNISDKQYNDNVTTLYLAAAF